MRKSSIFSSITFIFLMATLGVIFTFILFYQYNKEQQKKIFLNRYALLSKSIQYQLVFSPDLKGFLKLLKEFHMEPVKDIKKALYIINHTPIVYQHTSSIGTALILKDSKNAYLYITTTKYSLLLKDKEYNSNRNIIYYTIFISILILIIMAYILTIKKLLPLKKLKKEIDKFAKGDLDVNVRLDNEDEIAEVANAFDNAVKQIKRLNSSRILFLRNIMHELKTPITKGRITAEMLPDGKNKERLISVFEKLHSLIEEFITIEKISSGFMNLDKKSFRLIDIIDEAIDLAMVDKDRIELICSKKEITLKADFKLFSIAIKNMIDNAIKYSPDKKVQIIINDKAIIFKNRGDKLKKDLKEYMEPFTSDGNQKDSFGLGLYLVDNILRAHKLQLLYTYEDGYNIFIFKGLDKLIV